MGTDTANYLWSRLRDLLRNIPLAPMDNALFVGRLAAWHCLPAKLLPAAAQLPKDINALSIPHLRQAWTMIGESEGLGFRRFAFSNALDFPYDSVSDELLRQVCQEVTAVLLLSAQGRAAFADLVFQAFDEEGLSGLPVEIADLSLRLLQAKAGEEIACIGSRVDSLAVAANRLKLRPFLLCNSPPVAASLHGTIAGTNQEVVLLDPFGLSGQKLIAKKIPNRGVVAPAWGQKIHGEEVTAVMPSRFGVQSHEALAIELASTHIKNRAVVVVPNGVLFNKGREKALRQHLIKEGRVSAVVAFPSGLLRQTAIPFNLVLLRAACNDHSVRFFQVGDTVHLTGRGKLRVHQRRFLGTEAVSRTILEPLKPPFNVPGFAIAKEQYIAQQDYIMVPSRYFLRPKALPSIHSEELGKLVEIIKPQFLPAAAERDDEAEIREVSPGDLPDYGYLQSLERTRFVKRGVLKSRSKQILQNNDVLLSSKGTIGRVGIIGNLDAQLPMLASQSLLILRPREGNSAVDPRYLLMFLKSPLAQRIIRSLAVGVTVPNIALSEIRRLVVAIPTRREQQNLIGAFEKQFELQNEVIKLQHNQRSLALNAWKAVGLNGQEPNEPFRRIAEEPVDPECLG